jgi:hypothetical protein
VNFISFFQSSFIYFGSGSGQKFPIRPKVSDPMGSGSTTLNANIGDLLYLDEELAAAVAEELVQANLDLEGGNLVLLQQLVVSCRHERVRLRARQRTAQHVTQRNVLEA